MGALLRNAGDCNEGLVEPDWTDEVIQMRKHRSTREAIHTRYVARGGADSAMAYGIYCDHIKRFQRETSKPCALSKNQHGQSKLTMPVTDKLHGPVARAMTLSSNC